MSGIMANHYWSNTKTWNVWYHIVNDAKLLACAVAYMQDYKPKTDQYRVFIKWMGLDTHKTDDGIDWLDIDIDLTEINHFMIELAKEEKNA